MSSVTPFRIDVPDSALSDLQQRLTNTRWPEAQTVDDWSQGIPLAYTHELAEYWAHTYDWRARETALNRFDHFTTELDGLDIHFIHQRCGRDDAFPLLITHGWPGSIVEFADVIAPLNDAGFDVVCPSLPGYGFSAKPVHAGWGIEKIAAAWDALMVRLGYDRYGAQGGDWGSVITGQIGRNVGNCVGIHTNMPIGRVPKDLSAPTEEEQQALTAMKRRQDWETGYFTQQSTRPQTLGYGLVDSPVAQLAWIVEKFYAWTDCDGHPENAVPRDKMLDNVMLYWLTASGASSARLYWETFNGGRKGDPISLPTGVASFPKEIIRMPRRWCEDSYHITHWTDMPRGGHFAALEQPDLFVDDVRTFFDTVR
ncbi:MULTISPECIES: epoxide hydrolase family protein [Mycobacteriaceae]|uniref:epoxide hydrolase family protein n=1 Tax=Mycobacteriaceae TaxID=1762 RepID=UPI0007FE832C|nr:MULTISPECIES: epoxide hydrolase [Mycobacteriaceae]MCK0172695.1 epoxide hydrolase 1 [Mycolicibacterium sp. F2034L]OBB61915.1 epoxide hydrolase [Mycobacterium sp. 852013-51886_SCH5428379]